MSAPADFWDMLTESATRSAALYACVPMPCEAEARLAVDTDGTRVVVYADGVRLARLTVEEARSFQRALSRTTSSAEACRREAGLSAADDAAPAPTRSNVSYPDPFAKESQ